MDENNRKGPGIFYAVVGVATLVVAIIGATFAFFSASATSGAEDIKGSTAEAAGLALTVTPVAGTKYDGLIPVNFKTGETPGKDTVDQFGPAMTGKCVDANGNKVCQIYKITLTNSSKTSAVQVRGDLTLTSQATNIRWQLINVADETLATAPTEITGHEVDATSVTAINTKGQLVREGVDGAVGTGETARKDLAASATATYYVVIWLEETGTDQGTADAKKTFTGEVNFNAVDATGNTSGITASF